MPGKKMYLLHSNLLHPSSSFITGVGARSKRTIELHSDTFPYCGLLHLKESCPLVLPEQKALYATIKTTFIVTYLWMLSRSV